MMDSLAVQNSFAVFGAWQCCIICIPNVLSSLLSFYAGHVVIHLLNLTHGNYRIEISFSSITLSSNDVHPTVQQKPSSSSQVTYRNYLSFKMQSFNLSQLKITKSASFIRFSENLAKSFIVNIKIETRAHDE